MEVKNGNGESKIRKVMFNEVTFVVALVSLISGGIFWVTNPQNAMEIRVVQIESQLESNETIVVALEKIKNNDFHELQLKMDKLEDRQVKMLESLAAINQQLLSNQK